LAAQEKTTDDAGARPNAVRHPERNRKALVDATLDSIADKGITDTSVSRIVEKAGLSRGMIHLHFGGKDNLMAAAAEAFGVASYEEMERQVAAAGDDPAAQVIAVLRTDLGEVLLNPRSARIWHAFRGEARANPSVAQYSDTRDRRLSGMLRDAFDRIALAEGLADGPILARDATYGMLALLEGMWTDYLTHSEAAFSREAALRIACRFLAGLFPAHFGPVLAGLDADGATGQAV
jgi:TetR/AcrR family transcriptional repressor of bet genes